MSKYDDLIRQFRSEPIAAASIPLLAYAANEAWRDGGEQSSEATLEEQLARLDEELALAGIRRSGASPSPPLASQYEEKR